MIYLDNLSNSFKCHIGVRQGECLSQFLFSMFVYDIEETFIQQGVSGIDFFKYFENVFNFIC